MPRENRIIPEIIIAKSIDSSYSFKQYNPTMILAKFTGGKKFLEMLC